MDKKPKRPRDVSQLAKMMVDIASGETEILPPERQKDPAAVARGRTGGLKGGVVRSERLSASEREKIASEAAKVRWKKY
jgi:hypothetical protein